MELAVGAPTGRKGRLEQRGQTDVRLESEEPVGEVATEDREAQVAPGAVRWWWYPQRDRCWPGWWTPKAVVVWEERVVGRALGVLVEKVGGVMQVPAGARMVRQGPPVRTERPVLPVRKEAVDREHRS